MIEQPPERLQRAIKAMHGLDARFLSVQRVEETFRGETVWQGDVYMFAIDTPKATRCYAWLAANDDTRGGEPVAVLGEHPVSSPLAAVRAWIVAREKAKRR